MDPHLVANASRNGGFNPFSNPLSLSCFTATFQVDRIASAVGGRSNPDFVIMARTDSFANEGQSTLIHPAQFFVICWCSHCICVLFVFPLGPELLLVLLSLAI